MTPKPWENGEGYPDPTAYNALRPIMQEDAPWRERSIFSSRYSSLS